MKYNVLIVEDDSVMRILIKQTLKESGLEIKEIYEAVNGEKGLAALEVYEIDLLLVDIYMPIMDGIEMLEHVNEHPEHKKIPVVVISTENDERRVDAIVKRGHGFVHKPFTRDLLEEKIKKLTDTKNEKSIR